jgi:hypothetical protein
MKTYNENYLELSKKTELSFKEWLDRHNIPYMYIQQDPETFSTFFRDFNGKRPDFMILIPHFGSIFVDVKYKKLTEKYKDFALDSIDAKKYSVLQRKFNIHTWYAISNDDYEYKTWFWIPASKVLEEGLPKYVSSKSRMDFIPIKLNKFIQLSIEDSLDKLFSNIID